MKKIGIVFSSKTDVTAQLASSIIDGIQSVSDILIVEHRIKATEIVDGRFENGELFEELESCDAIAFGSPTYMGNASAQFKAFADATSELWIEQRWADKLAIGFTSGTGMNGDQSDTLQYFMTLANQHGMLWLGLDTHAHRDEQLNRMGCQKGIVAYAPDNELHPSDALTAAYLGKRLAKFVKKV